MAQEPKPGPRKIPITNGPSEADEIAQLLTKRAHCPHHFRYAMLCENRKTHDETMFTWCEHCGVGYRTTFVDDEQEVS